MLTSPPGRTTRRRFLQATGAGVAMFHIVPSHVLGKPGQVAANEKLNIAGIGVGSRGGVDVNAVASENIVALCDVDMKYAAKAFDKYPQAKRFTDYRQMLDKMDKQIDAVVIGTPDHTHAVIATEAMRRGKHIYCEKPLAHSVHEVRELMKMAEESGVVTQLGNQGHSSERIRMLCEWVWDGAIGEVPEVHAGCDAFRNIYCQIDKLPELSKTFDKPEQLDWDLWLGPAQYRDYKPFFAHWKWRGWMPFGTGCVGDWFCHVVDPSFWALDLDAPSSVVAEVKDYDPQKHALCYPPATTITFEFPAKGDRGPVKLVWFDGADRIPRPDDLEEGRKGQTTGAYLLGTKGTIMHGSHGAGGCRIIPEEKMRAYEQPEKTIPRVRSHHHDWLEAIRSGGKAGSDFAGYGGPITQAALLGAIAIRFPTQKLEWDDKAMKFTNFDQANAYINPPYRDGWSL